MTKLEFMKELESLLSDIPLEEREEALRYYNGYFEDAGEEHEEEIIKELVSPARVASMIKEDLNSNAAERESRGYFTENGYKDTIYGDERYGIVGARRKEAGSDNTNRSQNSYHESRYSGSRQTDNQARKETKNSNTGLIILVCILGFPFIISAFGIIFGIVVTIIGLLFGFGVAGVTMIGVGIALFIAGLLQIGVPIIGLLLCGSGLFVLGLGMLFTLACITLCRKALPALIRGVVAIFRKPFQNRSVAA